MVRHNNYNYHADEDDHEDNDNEDEKGGDEDLGTYMWRLTSPTQRGDNIMNDDHDDDDVENDDNDDDDDHNKAVNVNAALTYPTQ